MSGFWSSSIKGSIAISSAGAEDFIINYELYCYFNTGFCGSVVVVESCHRLTTCP